MLVKRLKAPSPKVDRDRYDGALVTSARSLLGLTQVQLAQHVNWSAKSISSWELGHTVPSGGLVDAVITFMKSQGIDFMEDGIRFIRPHETRTRLPDLLAIMRRIYVLYHPVFEIEDRLALRACLLDFGVEPDAEIEKIEVPPPAPEPAATPAEPAVLEGPDNPLEGFTQDGDITS